MEDTFDNQLLMNLIPSEDVGGGMACLAASAQWQHGCIPPCTDYYNNSFASSSPTHSFNLPSPVDYNSYSPPDSHSSSSSCYNSPTRMDMNCSFVPENSQYLHCDLQRCSCVSNWAGMQDAVPVSQYSLHSAADCYYSCGEDAYRRDFSSSELCYL
ncbi:colorectal cancer associated 2 [Brachyhypopomus gauderio]|uniref:colorectal cancer associated 2 n=1 Tax=Brachyhypopomus gauderio TaxID=698409 RepID=UPI0040419099